MRVIALILWGAGALLSALCVSVPEVRAHFTVEHFGMGKDKQVGLTCCVGLAVLFWLPAIIYAAVVTGLIAESYMFGVYAAAVLGALIAIIGVWLDVLT